MIDDAKLAEWQKLCDTATKEPWKAYEYVRGDKWEIFGGDRGKQLVSHGSHQYDLETGHCILRADNANFIAAARTALPEAIAEIRRLRKELAEERQHDGSGISVVRRAKRRIEP